MSDSVRIIASGCREGGVFMIIFSVVVYPLPSGEPMAASLSQHVLRMDPHEKIIRENMRSLADLVLDQYGIHTLKTPDGIYYALVEPNKLSFWAASEEVSTHAQLAVFSKIREAKRTKDLLDIIKEPELAVKTKVDIALEQVAEVKAIVIKDIEHLMSRGEKIEELLPKTEALVQQVVKFKQEAIKVRRQSQCPGLFSLFTSVKNYFWGGTYDYEYQPNKKTAMLDKEITSPSPMLKH